MTNYLPPDLPVGAPPGPADREPFFVPANATSLDYPDAGWYYDYTIVSHGDGFVKTVNYRCTCGPFLTSNEAAEHAAKG